LKSKTAVVSAVIRSFQGARRAAALLAGLMISLAVPASGVTIGISGGILIVGTESGDGNQVFSPTISGPDLVLPNQNAAIVTPGCSGVGTILCPLAGFQELVILGGDGDDVIQLSGIAGLMFPIIAIGGPGDDVLIGTPGPVDLFGGSGDDVLTNMPGNCFSRGTGNDIVLGSGCNAGPDPSFAPLPRTVSQTPEPGGLLLVGTALVGLGATRRRSRLRGVSSSIGSPRRAWERRWRSVLRWHAPCSVRP